MKEVQKMKRIISAVLVCILMVGCVFALASCGGPNSDPAKAKASLDEAGYSVTKLDASGSVVEKGIIVAMNLAGIDNIKSVVTAKKDADEITIIYFADSDCAKAELADVQDYADKTCKQVGALIYYGTEAAVKAAR